MKLLGGGAAWPLTARAQQREKVRRIGVLITLTARDSEARAWVSALKEGLQKLGWEQDRNIIPTAYGLSPPNWWNWHLT